MNNQLLLQLRQHLIIAAIPEKAPGMQKYMKSSMPYIGVPMPTLRKICKALFSSYEPSHFSSWQSDVLTIWNQALYREERYAAIFLTGIKQVQRFQQIESLPLYETLITTGAWWDYVDEIATHRLSQLILHQPETMKKSMLSWSKDDNIWKRRSAILCQIPLKEKTDLKFLYACIEPSLVSKEFFLRKAIGWALRQYAWINPEEIQRYVKEQENQLSSFSKKEALKNQKK